MAELPSADGIQGVEDRDAGVGTPDTEADEDDDSDASEPGGGTQDVASDPEPAVDPDEGEADDPDPLPDSETSTVVFEDEATNEEGQAVPGDVKGVVKDNETEQRVQDFAEQQTRLQDQKQRTRTRQRRRRQQAQQNNTLGSTRRSARQIRRSIAQNDQVLNQLEENTREPGTLNTVTEQVLKPSGRTLANIGGTLSEGFTEIGTLTLQGQVQGAKETIDVLQNDGASGLAQQFQDDAGEFVDDITSLDFTTDTNTVQDLPANFDQTDDVEPNPVAEFVLPETNNPLGESDVQSAMFTTGGAVAVPLAGTALGAGAAGATGATIEVVDQAPNVARLGQSIATGNVPGISSSATAIGVDLLPVGSAKTKRGTPTDQTTLASDFDRQRIERARKQDEVDTSLDVEPDQLVGVTTKGRQARLDQDEFTFDVVDERLPRDLTLETQSGETVATNLERNRNPDPETTPNIELARADQADTVPGEKARPDDQTTLQDEFTNDASSDPTDVEGVVEGQTGQTIVTDEGVIKLEETTESSFSPVIDDRKGTAKPITQVIDDVTPSTDITTDTEQVVKDIEDATTPGKADPDTTPGEQFLSQTDIDADTPVSLTGVDEDVQVGDGVTQPLDGNLDLDTGLDQDLDVTPDTQQDLDVTPDTDVDQALDVDTTTDTSLTTDTTTTTTTTQTTQQTNTNTNTNTNTKTNTKRRRFDIEDEDLNADQFTALVKDEGEFEEVGTFDNVGSAFDQAVNRVENSDDMTFQVVTPSGEPVDADPASDFRKSKSTGGFVEKRKDAINTLGEKQDITAEADVPINGLDNRGRGVGFDDLQGQQRSNSLGRGPFFDDENDDGDEVSLPEVEDVL